MMRMYVAQMLGGCLIIACFDDVTLSLQQNCDDPVILDTRDKKQL